MREILQRKIDGLEEREREKKSPGIIMRKRDFTEKESQVDGCCRFGMRLREIRDDVEIDCAIYQGQLQPNSRSLGSSPLSHHHEWGGALCVFCFRRVEGARMLSSRNEGGDK